MLSFGFWISAELAGYIFYHSGLKGIEALNPTLKHFRSEGWDQVVRGQYLEARGLTTWKIHPLQAGRPPMYPGQGRDHS